jgi:hypothetical protein
MGTVFVEAGGGVELRFRNAKPSASTSAAVAPDKASGIQEGHPARVRSVLLSRSAARTGKTRTPRRICSNFLLVGLRVRIERDDLFHRDDCLVVLLGLLIQRGEQRVRGRGRGQQRGGLGREGQGGFRLILLGQREGAGEQSATRSCSRSVWTTVASSPARTESGVIFSPHSRQNLLPMGLRVLHCVQIMGMLHETQTGGCLSLGRYGLPRCS